MLRLDGLDRGDRDDIDNIFRRAAAREIIGWASEALQDWPDGGCASRAFDEFVRDVAGVEIGEYQHIGAAGNRRAGRLGGTDGGHDGSIGLQFAVNQKLGPPRAGNAQGFGHLVHVLMFRRTFGRMRKQRDARLDLEERVGIFRRGDSDFSEFGGTWVLDHGAIGEQHRSALAHYGAVARRDDHQKETREQFGAGRQSDAVKCRTHGFRRRVHRASHGTVGVPRRDHQLREIKRLSDDSIGVIERNAAGTATLEVDSGVGIKIGARRGLEDRNALEREFLIAGVSFDYGFAADQRQARKAFTADLRCRGDDARIFAFRKNNPLRKRPCAIGEFPGEMHSHPKLPHFRCAWISCARAVERALAAANLVKFGPRLGGDVRSPRSIRHNGKRLSDILEAHRHFLNGEDLKGRAELSGADLSNADLKRVNLAYANLRGANLEDASLLEAKLTFADLSQANLKGADLRRTDSTETNFGGANLSGAQVNGVELFRADLSGANLSGANLTAANFRNANVHGANFHGANMTTTVLRETDLEGVDLSGLDLSTTLLPRNWKSTAQGKS